MAALWVCFCAFLNCAGWLLSCFRALNPVGYVFALIGGILLALWWRDAFGLKYFTLPNGRKLRRRFTRLLPGGFAIVAGLAFLGGLLHPPSNYDALAYRVPRVLNWLAQEQWHWIHTDFQRLNTRAPGFEWVAAPFTALLGTDRRWFLINIVCLLLMPGLVFSLYRRLGVSARVAWSWMWLLPTGYSFVLQAGGIGNDIFGAFFALAAVEFALRARTSGRFSDVAVSALAVALLSSSKTSNLPLGLPWLLAVLPCWRIVLKRPIAATIVAVAALLSSFVPMAYLNHRHTADWTGAHAERMYPERYDPRVTVPGNVMALTVQNLAPPIFPLANKWNDFAPRLIPDEFHERLKSHFEPSAANLAVSEMQNEEFCGLGFGLCCLVAVSLIAGLRHKRSSAKVRGPTWVRWSPWISALVYIVKTAIGTTARIFTPYYLLLLPVFLVSPRQRYVCRQHWWRYAAVLVYVIAALLIILTPSRPIWPANTILAALIARNPGNAKLERIQTVYSVYGQRADALAAIRPLLPAGEKIFGAVTHDDPETSLWRPFGSRRILHVLRDDTREQVLSRGIRYVLVNRTVLGSDADMEAWLRRMGGRIEHSVEMRYRAAFPPFTWHIVKLE